MSSSASLGPVLCISFMEVIPSQVGQVVEVVTDILVCLEELCNGCEDTS